MDDNNFKENHLTRLEMNNYANAIIEEKVDLLEESIVNHVTQCPKCAVAISDLKNIKLSVEQQLSGGRGEKELDIPNSISIDSNIGKAVTTKFPVVGFSNSRNQSFTFENFSNFLYIDKIIFSTSNNDFYKHSQKILLINCATNERKTLRFSKKLPFALDFTDIVKEGSYRCILTIENKLGDIEKIKGVFSIITRKTYLELKNQNPK